VTVVVYGTGNARANEAAALQRQRARLARSGAPRRTRASRRPVEAFQTPALPSFSTVSRLPIATGGLGFIYAVAVGEASAAATFAVRARRMPIP
jgi:hypothetical protein